VKYQCAFRKIAVIPLQLDQQVGMNFGMQCAPAGRYDRLKLSS
jgi:hypothetical protein